MNLDSALGIHPDMLNFRAQRAQVLANNIANVDTPNFKSQDLVFDAVFRQNNLSQSTSIHPETKYRIPYQRTIDGNTVELSVEQAQFAKNQIDYQTSLTFLKLKIRGLRGAIEGK
ncbi:flagellar basal body rod protein FlgB [Vibrio sp.]|nr:flagellar basal body rod protein FlgB [Vibrio sp.]